MSVAALAGPPDRPAFGPSSSSGWRRRRRNYAARSAGDRAYFDQADAQLSTSRRVTETLFIGNLRQHIVADLRQQVLGSVHRELQETRRELQELRQQVTQELASSRG